jgi:hypothetical protein
MQYLCHCSASVKNTLDLRDQEETVKCLSKEQLLHRNPNTQYIYLLKFAWRAPAHTTPPGTTIVITTTIICFNILIQQPQ